MTFQELQSQYTDKHVTQYYQKSIH